MGERSGSILMLMRLCKFEVCVCVAHHLPDGSLMPVSF